MSKMRWADAYYLKFIEDYKVIDKIIDHLKLTFKAESTPEISPHYQGKRGFSV